jgi:hypothetical protein
MVRSDKFKTVVLSGTISTCPGTIGFKFTNAYVYFDFCKEAEIIRSPYS